MVSALLAFDKLAYIDRLKSSGIEDGQARAHAEALDAALRDSVATKSDIDVLRRDLQATETKLSVQMESLETRLKANNEILAAGVKGDILRWLLMTQAALAGFIFAVLKFLH